MEKLEYTVRQTICRYHMLQPGDQVVIALSGGADSVCLLSLLADMREEMGLKLRSLHVHHGLRGEEADRDGDFSIKISEALGVRGKKICIPDGDVGRRSRKDPAL